MVRIKKLYFDLEEITERWELRKHDLAYMAENDELKVSVRLYTVRLEEGIYERDTRDGQPHRIPFDQSWFSGLQDLTACDAHKVFHHGQAPVVQFDAPGDAYVEIIEPTAAVVVQLRQLVVRREERDRIERDRKPLPRPATGEAEILKHSRDYRHVQLGELSLTLGRMQARIVRQLYRAGRTGDGWCSGKVVLAEAGSASKRMQDVFKSQPRWRELIESDRHGHYRLRVETR